MRGIASIANAVAPVARDGLVARAVGQRGEEADEDAVGPERGDLAVLRRRDLRHHVGLPGAVAERRAGVREQRVGDPGRGARAGLDHDLVALADQLAHDVGHERDPPLALHRLLRDPDPHERGNLSQGAAGVRRIRAQGSRLRVTIAASTPAVRALRGVAAGSATATAASGVSRGAAGGGTATAAGAETGSAGSAAPPPGWPPARASRRARSLPPRGGRAAPARSAAPSPRAPSAPAR